jgi:hypothetical protein
LVVKGALSSQLHSQGHQLHRVPSAQHFPNAHPSCNWHSWWHTQVCALAQKQTNPPIVAV